MENTLSINCAKAILDAPKSERKALTWVFSNYISPNKNTAKRIVENFVAVGINRKISVAELIKNNNISLLLLSNKSGPEKIKAIDNALIRLRYPVLTKEIERLKREIGALDLTNGTTITLPKNLEGGKLIITIGARNQKELSRELHEIKKGLERGGFEKIFKAIE